MKKRKHRALRWIGGIAAALVILVAAGAIIWVNKTYKPNEEAKAVLSGTQKVTVTKDTYIEFLPTDRQPDKGFIFYPGGLVEPEAYAPLCEKIAEQGYLVVIVPMTANLAILSPNKAEGVQKAYPFIKTWAIGGHSLGGVVACRYANSHEDIAGVVLYAAYPESDELEGSSKKIISIYGSLDGVAKLDKVKGAKLPLDAKLKEIQGGNHSYFGSYGLQKGDNEATISNAEQLMMAASYTTDFLKRLSE